MRKSNVRYKLHTTDYWAYLALLIIFMFHTFVPAELQSHSSRRPHRISTFCIVNAGMSSHARLSHFLGHGWCRINLFKVMPPQCRLWTLHQGWLTTESLSICPGITSWTFVCMAMLRLPRHRPLIWRSRSQDGNSAWVMAKVCCHVQWFMRDFRMILHVGPRRKFNVVYFVCVCVFLSRALTQCRVRRQRNVPTDEYCISQMRLMCGRFKFSWNTLDINCHLRKPFECSLCIHDMKSLSSSKFQILVCITRSPLSQAASTTSCWIPENDLLWRGDSCCTRRSWWNIHYKTARKQ